MTTARAHCACQPWPRTCGVHMSKADSDSIRKPTPVTVTVAEVTSLCDRLAARAKSVLLADQPEQGRDLDFAARIIRTILRVGWQGTSVRALLNMPTELT